MFWGGSSGWEAWLLVLFVPATIASILRYVTFRLRYDDNELVIRSLRPNGDLGSRRTIWVVRVGDLGARAVWNPTAPSMIPF